MDEEEIKVGDVVQINPAAGLDPCWWAVYMLVTEVKPWGIMAVNYSPNAGERNKPPGEFYLKLTDEEGPLKYFRVGESPVVPGPVAKKIWPDTEEA